MNGANKITKLVLSLLMTISCINFSTVQAEDSEPSATSIPAEEVIAEPTPTTEGSTDEVLPAASPAAEVTAVPELVEDENSDPVPTAAAGTEGEGTVVPAPVPTEEPGVEQQEEAVKDYSENILFDANTDITYNEDYTVAFVTMKLDTAEDMHLYFANEEEAIQNNEFVSVDTEKTSADKKLWVLDITKNGEYTLDAQARNNETSEVLGTKQITFTVTDIAEKVAEPVKSAPVLRAPSAVISEEPTVASEVQLNEFYIVAEKNLITVGQTMNITAHFDPADYENQAVTWQSADSSIATVDENGKVTAIAEGNVRVTATAQANTDFTDSVTISVDPVKVNKIAISGYSKEYMTPGETVTLTYTVSPDNAEDKTVVWSSLNEDVVTVNQSGLVTAIGSGTTTVRATNPLTGIYSEQSITVYDATPVTQTVYVWVTNQYQNTSYTFNIPKDGTEVTPVQVARNSTGTQGTLVTKAEFRVGDFTSGSYWGSIQSNGLVEAFRYNTSSKKVQYKLAGSDWKNLGSNKVYDFSVVKYTSSDVTVNDTDVAVSVGDWPYTDYWNKHDNQNKTIQIIIHNNETNTDVYNSGVLHYDNRSNGNYGKINFNCNQSKYKVTQVVVTKGGQVQKTYTEGSIPEDLEVNFNGNQDNKETYVITATIAAKTIHVTYSSEGTVTNMPKATTTKTTGTVDVSDQVPVRDGYIFTGWAYVDGGTTTIYHGGDSFDAPIHDVELRAQWLKMSDQINYVVNDPAMGTVSRSYERVGGTSGKPAKGSVARAKEGYRFVHWTDADNKEVSTEALYVPTSTEAATYTAVFEALNSNLIIHYTDDKGNKIREDDTKEYAYGAEWTEEAPEIQGYKRPSNTTQSGVKNNTTEEITFIYTQKKGKVVYNLSDKGSWGNGAPDQVEEFDALKGKWAYTYGFDKDDTFVVTDKIPVSSDNAAFVGWYDKKRGKQPATMRTAGQTLTYPYTETSPTNTYTLDALWETLHGEDKVVTYDGESYSLDEFTAQFANENLGEWTDSASSLVALESLQYRIKYADGTYGEWGTMPSFKDAGVYTIQAQAVVNGVTLTAEATLTINKRNVILTSADDSKVYDTTPLTKHVVDITEDGFANGEGADYQFTGSQTEVGSSDNTFTYTLKSNTLASNYNVEVHYGTLKVTPVEKEITVTITGNTATETYDGNTHSVEGYKVTGVSDVLYAKENVEFTGIARAEGTEAGTYYMNLNVAQFTNNSSNFTNVKFVVTDGYLKINPKSIEDEDSGITVTNPDDTIYDGTSQKLEPTVYDSKTNTLLVKDKDYYLDYSKDTTNAGEVAIIVKGKGNYSGSKSASYKITPRAVILTSEGTTRPYDGTPLTRPTVTMTGEGFVKGEVEDIKATGTITNVGSVENTITYTRLDKFKESNYNIKEDKGTLIITAKEVTVTAKNSGKVFGEADPELEAEVRGVITGESVDLIKYTVSRKPGETVGDYPITVSGDEKQGNYVVTYIPAKFTITKSGELTLTVDLTGEAAAKVYDGKPLTGGAKASVTEGTTITYSIDGETWTTEVPSITDVGTLNVTAKAENPNYDTITVDYTLTVTTKEVIVTTPDKDKVYDGTALTAEGTITGFVNDETATFTTTGSQTEVGSSDNTYAIVWNGTAKVGNYVIDPTVGTLTVTEQSIDPEIPGYKGVEIDRPENKVYTGLEQKWSPTVTDKDGNALVNDVDYEVSYDTDDFTNVTGTITVTITGKGNYTGSVTRTYEITPATLTVTTPDKDKVYDGQPLTAEGTITGFVNEETATFTTTGSQTEVGHSENTYSIAWDGTAKETNYTVSEVLGTLTVKENEEEIIVTTTGGTFTYDGNPHGATVTVSTLPKGYTLETATSSATATDVTDKDITAECDTLVIKNAAGEDVTGKLKITKVPGTIKITPAPLSITTDSDSKVYDGKPLTADGRIEGLVNNEEVTFTVTGSQTTVGTSDNTYTLEFDKTAKEGNYSIADKDIHIGKLTVTAQSIDPEDPDYNGISIDEPIDVTYDGEEHKWSPTVTDKENTALVENVDYTVSYNTDNFINVQTIVVTIKGTGNYSGTVVRTYRITPATVTVTANDDSKVYGEEDPAFTAAVTGLVEKDEGKVTIDYTTDRDGGEDVGEYTITPKGEMTQGNYIVEYATGTFEITPRSIKPDTPDTPEEEKTGIKVNNASDSIYNGEEHKFIPEITNKDDNKLVDGKDYEVSYSTDDFTNVTGEIVVTIKGKGNYTGEFTDSYQITERYVRLSSADASRPYDGTPLTRPTVTVTGDGFVEGEVEDIEATGTITNIGSVENTITYTRLDKFKESNYNITEKPGTLTITAKEVTVTANNANKVYGEKDPELTTTVTGTLGEDKVTYTLTRDPGEDVGKYAIHVTGDADQGNYHVTYTAGEFEITKSGELILTAELTGESATKVYDGTPLTGGATASVKEGTTITYSTDGENWTTEVPGITNVGELSVTAKAENPNYEPAETTYSLTVTHATATVTAEDKTKTYGEADPAFTAKVEGIIAIEKDTVHIAYDQPLTRDPGEAKGTYTIHVTGETTQGNYHVEYVAGTLEITQKSLEDEDNGIEVTNPDDTIYDGTSQKLKPTVVDTKTNATLTEGTDYYLDYSEDTTNVGTVAIMIKGTGNYSGSKAASYKITPRTVKLASEDATKPYDGTPLTRPTVTVTGDGFVEGEVEDIEATGTITNIGSVENTITYTRLDKFKESNYNITEKPGTLTITAKEVTVTANNANKVYGEKDPELTTTVTGTLGEDKVTYTLTRDPGEDVGKYAIHVTGDADQGNYHVTYTAGEFEITKSGELILTAELTGESATKVYDGTPLTGGATASVKEGTTITYSTDGENWTTEVPGITNVGELSVTAKAENPNYEPAETTYSLTVTHATATVTAEDKTKTYGEADPAFTAKVEGIIAIEKDTVHIAYDQPLTRDPGEAKGTYTIHVTGETTQGNYHVEYVAGTLEITQKSLEDEDNGIEVTNPDDTVYDGTSQKLKPTVADTKTNATLTEGTDYYLDYSADTTNVGTVAIMIKGTGNYSGSKAASYKITPKPYTVTTESASKTYDGKALTAGGSIDGIVEGETVIVHTTGSQTEVGSSANTYTLEWKDCSKENYTLADETIGTLTVTQQTIDPEDPDPEKEYLGVTVDTPSDVTYDGNEHKWTPTVLDAEGKALTEGTDYTVSYDTEDFTNVHTITVTIEGIGNYTGTVVRTYAITPAEVTVTANNTGKVYGEADPELTAKVEGTIGNDKVIFKLERDPGEDVGTYVINVTGEEKQGNYHVTYTAGEFEITPKSIIPVTPEEPGKDANITVETPEDVKYNGESQQQKPVIKDDKGNVLEEGKDYTLEFCEDTTNAGTVTVTVTGINNYEGTFDVQYNILPRDITMTSGNAEKVYDGTALTNGEIVITGDGFVVGEGVTYNVTGTQTEAGSSANTFDYAFNENTLASNYKVTTVNGTLTVTPQQVVPVTPPQPPVNPGPEVTPQDTPTTAEVQTPTTTITEQKTPQTAPKKTETIKNDPTPEAAGKAYWALINLICAAITVVLAIFALLSKHKKEEDAKEDEDTDAQTVMSTEEDEEDPEISKRHRIWKVVGAVDAIVAVIVFFLTENMSLPMALTDKWTVLMVVFALISVVTTVLAKKWHKKDDDNAENSEEQNTLQNA